MVRTGSAARGGWVIARDAVALAALASALGLVVNALRPSGLPLIAEAPYDILVPCPETLGEVAAVELAAFRLAPARDLVVDARSGEAYARWHLEGAVSVPFDVLEPVCPAVVEALLQHPAQRVVVYGDVEQDLDLGYELARELAGRGLRNVVHVRGDSAALRARLEAGAHP